MDQYNDIIIDRGALLEAVKDANLRTDIGTTIALAEGHGKNLYSALLGTDLKEGNKPDPVKTYSNVVINGTVRVGIKNKLWLIIDADGNALNEGDEGTEAWMTQDLRIPFITSLESKETNLLNELAALQKLLDIYGGTDAEYAYQLQIDRVIADLEELGYGEVDDHGNFMPSYPFINYIILDDVWAQASYIYVYADNLYGSGTLIAPGDAEIYIENRSLNSLRLIDLNIPLTGGDIVFNGWLVSEQSGGSGFNQYIRNNNKNSEYSVAFNMNIGTGSGNEPKIKVKNTHPGDSSHNIQPPEIEVTGEINNINGSLELRSEGSVVVYGDINVANMNISGGKFVQNYIDTVYNTGGEPEYLWQGPVGIAEGLLVNYYGSYSGLYAFNEGDGEQC